MGEDIFQPAEEAIKAAGSDDPRDVAEHFGIMVVDLKGTIAGYATRYSKIPVIGLNVYLDDLWYRFGGWATSIILALPEGTGMAVSLHRMLTAGRFPDMSCGPTWYPPM